MNNITLFLNVQANGLANGGLTPSSEAPELPAGRIDYASQNNRLAYRTRLLELWPAAKAEAAALFAFLAS